MSLISLLARPFSRNQGERRTIETIYGMIVAQARRPAFYSAMDVPDTVDGRFDMLLLHLWMVLRRLRDVPGTEAVSQGLFDRFCDDMDANLREMGVGDLTVPKRMQSFGEAFYGRIAAYDAATAADRPSDALAVALSRNILGRAESGGEPSAAAKALCGYAEEVMAALAAIPNQALLACAWRFPESDIRGRA